jgi:hypothetical protein
MNTIRIDGRSKYGMVNRILTLHKSQCMMAKIIVKNLKIVRLNIKQVKTI